jgi:hypothetical protein
VSDVLSREKKKLIAGLRAERRLETRLADIDWEHEVLLPAVEKLEKNFTEGKKITIKAA